MGNGETEGSAGRVSDLALVGWCISLSDCSSARASTKVVGVFPLAIIGVLLLFEGLALMLLVRDMTASKTDLSIVILVGLIASGLPYGYLIGVVVGTALA